MSQFQWRGVVSRDQASASDYSERSGRATMCHLWERDVQASRKGDLVEFADPEAPSRKETRPSTRANARPNALRSSALVHLCSLLVTPLQRATATRAIRARVTAFSRAPQRAYGPRSFRESPVPDPCREPTRASRSL